MYFNGDLITCNGLFFPEETRDVRSGAPAELDGGIPILTG
jgi:hypothetical protein